MAELAGWRCDGCSVEKKPSNNWWKVFLLFAVSKPPETNPAADGVMILAFDKDEVSEPKQIGGSFIPKKANAHLCGHNCVTKLVSENLLSKT